MGNKIAWASQAIRLAIGSIFLESLTLGSSFKELEHQGQFFNFFGIL